MMRNFIVELLKAIQLNHEICSEELALTLRDALGNVSNSHDEGLDEEDLDRIWLWIACEENASSLGILTGGFDLNQASIASSCKMPAIGSSPTMPRLYFGNAQDFLQLSNNNGLAIRFGARQELGNNSTKSSRNFVKRMLVAHNEYRAVHQSPPLTINEDLNRMAQTWAEVLAGRDALAYDVKCDRIGIGENVARKCDIQGSEATAQEFVDTWYSEVSNFNWRSLDDQYNCSHFAQLVWRSSREAGFGRAVSFTGCVYVVGRYKPRGINPGEFPRNVLPRYVKPAQPPPDQEKQDISGGPNTTNMMANKLLPPKRAMMEAVAPTSSTLPAPPSANPPQVRDRSFNDAPSHITQDRSDHVNREISTRSSASQDRESSVKRESPPNAEKSTVPPRLSPLNTAQPASSKSLFASLAFSGKQQSQSTRTENVGSAASSAAPGPLSAMGLFGALNANDTDKRHAAPAAEASPLSAGSLFSSMSTKGVSDNAAASPMGFPMSAANVLRQAAKGTHGRDRELEEPEPQVPEFSIRKFLTQMLVSHNEYRFQHKAPPLKMNAELTRHAQEWAEVLALRDKIAHDPNCAALSQGENVAMKFKIGETNFSGDIFTELWYDEIEAYDWANNDLQLNCGHFTQLIWKSSSEVGFGRAVSETGRVYVVGRYKPPGNFQGEFKKNVIPSADDVTQEAPVEAQPIEQEEVAKSPLGALPDFGARGTAKTLPTIGTLNLQKAPDNGGLFSAMLLQRTMQNKRPPEKTAVEDDLNTFNLKKFETQLLVSHNEYRALHRSPPLRLNKELSKLASEWAQVVASKDKMSHDPKCGSLGLGENVAMKFRKGFLNFEGDTFTEMWYHEIDMYKWTGEDQLACGHFTQLVWRSSTEVGFGRAVSKSGRVYVVGRYKPPGNYSGQYGRNVLPPSRVMPKSRSNSASERPTKRLRAAMEAEQQQDRNASRMENSVVHGVVPEMSGFGGTETRGASAKGLALETSVRETKQAAEIKPGKSGSPKLAIAKLISGKFSTLKFAMATNVQTSTTKNQLSTQPGASYRPDTENETSVRDFEASPDVNPHFTNANYASQQLNGLNETAAVECSSTKHKWYKLISALLTERRKTAAVANQNWHKLVRALITAGREARVAGTSELLEAAVTTETNQQGTDTADGGENSPAN